MKKSQVFGAKAISHRAAIGLWMVMSLFGWLLLGVAVTLLAG